MEDNDKFIEWFTLYFAQQMKDGEIPADVWEMAIQDYNNDKEDGKVHEDDWNRQDQNEVIKHLDNCFLNCNYCAKEVAASTFKKHLNICELNIW